MGLARALARSRSTVTKWQIVSFVAGWLTLVVALLSPVHKLGSVLFAAHMTQHELLMLVAAPLLVLGRVEFVTFWALPLPTRVKLATVKKWRPIARTWAVLSAPLAVWLIHGSVLWIWHLPALYQTTLESEWIHAAQHTSFLLSALLFWWTLIHGRQGKLGYGAAVAYVFTTALHSSVLGALLTFAPGLWYPIYDGRTAAWGLTALEDQQLGGLIMWVPAGVVFIILGLALFAAWLGESERRLAFSRASILSHVTSRGQNG
jgi:cytochrome c oxidase assembly factor CtaG